MAIDLCSINMPNAGVPDCDKSRGIPRYVIVGSYAFTLAEIATIAAFKAKLKTQTLVGRNQSGKLIVLPIMPNIEKTTGDNLSGTLNQGFSEVLREGFPSFNGGFQISNNHAQKLRPLNGQDVKIFVLDDKLNIWGTFTSDSTFRGESAKLFVGGDDWSDGQASKTILLNVAYTDVEEFKANSAYFTIDFSVADYGRLKDVDLVEAAAAATNVFSITGKIKTGKAGYKLDVYTDFSVAMANAARWTCVNNQTGATHTITSVATNAGGFWLVTLDSTMWTALTSGQSVTLNWAAPSVLDAANVKNVEGVSIILTKP